MQKQKTDSILAFHHKLVVIFKIKKSYTLLFCFEMNLSLYILSPTPPTNNFFLNYNYTLNKINGRERNINKLIKKA